MWNPDEDDRKYLELISVMTTDCMLARGTVDKETFLSNLKIAIKQMEKEKIGVTP